MNNTVILVSGIWLIRRGPDILVLARNGGHWKRVISERADGPISHCVHPEGIETAPVDDLDAAEVLLGREV